MSTVSVTYFDKDGVLRALEDFVRAITTTRSEIAEVILFGSLAGGHPVPGSDVDLLLVLSESAEPFHARIPHYLPSRFPVGVDVFPYTRRELETMTAEGNAFVRGALREGRVLFRR